MKTSAQFTLGQVQCTIIPETNSPRSFSFAPKKGNDGSYEFVLENFSGQVVLKHLADTCVVFSHPVGADFSSLTSNKVTQNNVKPPTSAMKVGRTPMSINTPSPMPNKNGAKQFKIQAESPAFSEYSSTSLAIFSDSDEKRRESGCSVYDSEEEPGLDAAFQETQQDVNYDAALEDLIDDDSETEYEN
jgi:hypothetical protein